MDSLPRLRTTGFEHGDRQKRHDEEHRADGHMCESAPAQIGKGNPGEGEARSDTRGDMDSHLRQKERPEEEPKEEELQTLYSRF